MPANENKKVDTGQKNETGRPLSETIENAHAAGDGTLERDKDTVLEPKDEKQRDGEGSKSNSDEAY